MVGYSNNGSRSNSNQDLMRASPLHLVVMVYDVAITACERNDTERAANAVRLLRDALNFSYADVAEGLFSLYQWCLDCLKSGDVESAKSTLRELHNAWVTVEQRYTAPGEAGQKLQTAAPLPYRTNPVRSSKN